MGEMGKRSGSTATAVTTMPHRHDYTMHHTPKLQHTYTHSPLSSTRTCSLSSRPHLIQTRHGCAQTRLRSRLAIPCCRLRATPSTRGVEQYHSDQGGRGDQGFLSAAAPGSRKGACCWPDYHCGVIAIVRSVVKTLFEHAV